MALEDIHYLKKHGYKESYMFYVDSKYRDRDIYPSPSEYSVKFSFPFKNVFAIEVLDASIPRTQYSIDTHNNKLCLYHDGDDLVTIELEPGDYSESELLEYINNLMTQKGISLELQNVSDPATQKNTFRFLSRSAFTLDMENSTIREQLGFDEYAKKSDYGILYDKDIRGKRFFKSVKNVEIDPIKYNTFDAFNQSSVDSVTGFSNIEQNSEILNPGEAVYQKFTIGTESDGVYGYVSKLTIFLGTQDNNRQFNIAIARKKTINNVTSYELLNLGNTQTVVAKGTESTGIWEAPIDYFDDTSAEESKNALSVLTPGDYFIFIYGAIDSDIESESRPIPLKLSTLSNTSSEGITITSGVSFNNIDSDTQGTTFNEIQNEFTTTIVYNVDVNNMTSNIENTTSFSKFPDAPRTTVGNVTTLTDVYSYYISGNGETNREAPKLTLFKGNTYIFRYSDIRYPFTLYTTEHFGGDYDADQTNPSINSIEGSNVEIRYDSTNKEVTIIIPIDAPDSTIHYMSGDNQARMGNEISIEKTSTSILRTESKSLGFILETKENPHTVTAPGMYSLSGDRYVLLRCPEIEQHLYRSRGYERYTMGLAKFKLSVFGFDDTRFDFTKLPMREFHPIGKLSQMTFRFERPDGELYNFKGINHTITFAIRYYEPPKDHEFTEYTLNPNYNPNFLEMMQNEESTDDSDSD